MSSLFDWESWPGLVKLAVFVAGAGTVLGGLYYGITYEFFPLVSQLKPLTMFSIALFLCGLSALAVNSHTESASPLGYIILAVWLTFQLVIWGNQRRGIDYSEKKRFSGACDWLNSTLGGAIDKPAEIPSPVSPAHDGTPQEKASTPPALP